MKYGQFASRLDIRPLTSTNRWRINRTLPDEQRTAISDIPHHALTMILIESLFALVHSLQSATESHLGTLLPWLAGIEAAASLSLLHRRSTMVGGVVLLLIFAIALVIHGPVQQMPLF